MTLLLVLLAGLLTFALGRVLVRVLGWPRDLNGAMRWAMALLVVAVVYAGLPDLLAVLARSAGPLREELPPELRSIGLIDASVGFCLMGLAALGHVAWTRSAMERDARGRQAEQARFQERRRVAPPPPAAEDFEPLDPPHGPNAP